MPSAIVFLRPLGLRLKKVFAPNRFFPDSSVRHVRGRSGGDRRINNIMDIASKPDVTESPLSEAPLSTPLKVKRMTCMNRLLARLSSMGILPGEMVKVVHRCKGGPLLLEVKGARVALGRKVALTVIVGR